MTWVCRLSAIRGEFRLRLSLAGWGGTEEGPADGAGPRLEYAGAQSIRHQRVHRLDARGGTEPLFGLNFWDGIGRRRGGAGGVLQRGRRTKWSNLRRSHGYEQPHNVKYWCVGNEMDGTWQNWAHGGSRLRIKASDAARQMRVIDPTIKLIACGSSGPFQPTYIEWDRTVLEECYDVVDGISLHRYLEIPKRTATTARSTGHEPGNGPSDRGDPLLCATQCARTNGRTKQLFLSFDEWNVWYRARGGTSRTARKLAPHLLEEPYNLEDAVLVGGLANSLIRHSDRVKVACLAQLVNVIAPIATMRMDFAAYDFLSVCVGAEYAHGRALSVAPEGPSYQVASLGQPIESGGLSIPGFGTCSISTWWWFTMKRRACDTAGDESHLQNEQELEINWHDLTPSKVLAFETITGPDLKREIPSRSEAGDAADARESASGRG